MSAQSSRREVAQSGLRARAERTIAQVAAYPDSEQSLVHVVHELRVHQIELEMQADELLAARDDLEESRDRYRHLYEHAPVGYITTDFDGSITEANVEAEAILGISRPALLGLKLAQFLEPECADELHLHRTAVRALGRAETAKLRILRFGDSVDVQVQSTRSETPGLHSRSAFVDVSRLMRMERTLEEHTQRLSDANVALRHEVEERDKVQRALMEREARRQNAENALQRQKGFAERLIEAVPAIVLSLDAEGRVLGFNARMSLLSGYSIAEVIGDDWFERFVAEDARGGVREAFARALTGGRDEELTVVAPMLTKSGALRQIEWNYATLENQDGVTSGLVAIGQDVSDRRRIEEEVRQASKMEAVGTLASGIAHDFNNVLAGIIGCADVALSRLPGDSSARSALDQLKISALGGAQVIHRLMAFARRQPAARTVFDLNELVARLGSMLSRLLGEDIALHARLSDTNAAVRGQPDEIEQVLVNLCINARHAMPRGGELDLSIREVRIGEEIAAHSALPEGVYVVVEVTDTGTGMNAKTRERVFEPFFTTKLPGHGTGLGLASVYATVQNHGGHIDVVSELGKGTTFSVYLPQSTEAVKHTSEGPDSDMPLTVRPVGETVLVVEDEPLVRLGIRHYLERHGYHVLEAAHDEEVRRILDEYGGPIDVVLTDMVLPGKSGPEIAEQVRASRSNVRVIYVSAHPNEVLVSDGRLSPNTLTLQKPFTERALVTRVRESRPSLTVPKPPPLPGRVEGRPRLLLIEDHDDIRVTLEDLLTFLGYEVVACRDAAAAASTYGEPNARFDLLVTDVSLPDANGVELAKIVRRRFPVAGVLLLSGHASADVVGLESILAEPNTAYLQKPIDMTRLADALAGVLTSDRNADSSLN